MYKYYDIIIVGAGIAGISAIKEIRKHDTNKSILLVSNENRLPYKRTKINKHIAVGFSKNQFSLETEDWYKSQNITIMHSKAKSLNTKNSTLRLANDNEFKYNKLLLANGAVPNIPLIKGVDAADLKNVHWAENVETVLKDIEKKERFLIIGGGVEGLETADQLIKLGKNVVVVEKNNNPLIKLFPSKIASLIYKNAKEKGVQVFTQTIVDVIEKTTDGKFKWKYLNSDYYFDDIILCAGTKPNLDLVKNTNVEVSKGIRVNEYMQTSVSNIYAAGDVAEHKGGLVTGLWHPAEYQGKNAGKNIIGFNEEYNPVPLRLKTEIFGEFYFSANYFFKSSDRVMKESWQMGEEFVEVYLRDNKILGLVMTNNKKQAKIYHNAVANNFTLDQLKSMLKD